MASAPSGSALMVEVDDDVLVENAATATLFSPGMWVQRPSRTPLTRGGALADARHSRMDMSGVGSPGGMLLPIPLPSLAEPAAPRPACAAAPVAALPSTAGHAEAAAAAAAAAGPSSTQLGSERAAGRTPSSPGLGADPDLAYLSIEDERERERAEREYQRQDSEHMAALEEAKARLEEQNQAVEQHLKGVVASAGDVLDENRTIKQLLNMLRVRKEDFEFNQVQTIGAQQEAIGMRLLRGLEEGSPPAAAQQQQQQRQGPGAGACMQRQQQHNLRSGAAVPLHLQQQQQAAAAMQQQGGGGQPPFPSLGDAGLAAAAAAFDASPGCMLPLDTPSMLRTVSPKIAAFRSAGGDGLLGTGQFGAHASPFGVAAPPATPQDHPEEAQIAAAALTAKQGDAAAALLTLLDKAIEGRMVRQQHAAAQEVLLQEATAAAVAPQHGPPPMPPPQQQQQHDQQMYLM